MAASTGLAAVYLALVLGTPEAEPVSKKLPYLGGVPTPSFVQEIDREIEAERRSVLGRLRRRVREMSPRRTTVDEGGLAAMKRELTDFVDAVEGLVGIRTGGRRDEGR